MSKPNKEQVLNQFIAAYQAKYGNAPQIEQKGSWFKVDGAKSLRLAELAGLTATLSNEAAPLSSTGEAQNEISSASQTLLTPKQYWAQKLASGSQLPRGF
ncbi:MAG: hypothetical protein R3Y10_13370 [Ferrimonas sp.]